LFKSISSYSLNLVAFNIINYFSRNADYFLIGKFLGDQPLGHYYLAYRIVLFPLQNITLVIARVIFPTLSKIQDNNSEVRRFYLKITNTIAFVTFPLIGIIAFASKYFVPLVFGSEWRLDLITTLILILAPVGLIQSIASTVGSLYQIKAKTDWMFRWGLVYSSITILGFFIGLRWGVVGVAASYLVSNLLLVYPLFLFPLKLIQMNISKFFLSFKGLLFSLLLMIFSMGVASLFTYLIGNSLANLIIISCVGAISYLVVIYFLNREHYLEMKILLKQLSKS
jgi:PST family polysaccharide transporter